MSKLVLTRMEISGVPCWVSALSENNRTTELRLAREDAQSFLGNIYVGQVENLAENIGAAFVRIAEGRTCYLPLSETRYLRWTADKTIGQPLRPGDQILVQVSREAMKTKLPAVSGRLNFTGQYLALTTGEPGIGVSKKLGVKERLRVQEWAESKKELLTDCGMIVRTNAAQASVQELESEFVRLYQKFREVTEHGIHRTVGSLLYEQEPFFETCVRDVPKAQLEEIVTDLPEVYGELKASGAFSEQESETSTVLRFYDDSLLPLCKLYRMEQALSEIMSERVWLKSGGFLVIQQTEAFVSIDVNSGKFTGKKKAEETFRKINLEAAAEIARQLRLRNLSGSILIDFINLENPEHKEELFHVLQKHLRRDPVRANAVDITALNILEATRQKIRRPLAEELMELQKKF